MAKKLKLIKEVPILTFLSDLRTVEKDEYRTNLLFETFVIRYRNPHKTLRQQQECANCGLKATKVVLYESRNGLTIAHFKSKTNILFTCDHVFPLSKGGKNRIYNFQTMCSPCNSRKSNSIPSSHWDTTFKPFNWFEKLVFKLLKVKV